MTLVLAMLEKVSGLIHIQDSVLYSLAVCLYVAISIGNKILKHDDAIFILYRAVTNASHCPEPLFSSALMLFH